MAAVTSLASSQTFSALRERDFAWYFAGNIAFFMAMQMNMLLRGYLAFELTNLAIALGLVAVTMALPMLVVAPLGGVIADRYNKRTLLIVVQLFVFAINVLLAALILVDVIEFWHLLVVTLGYGAATSIAMPVRQAMVPQLVPQHRLTNAVSLQMGSMNLTRILGPALGGLLIAPLGLGLVWTLSALLYLVAVATVLPLPRFGMSADRDQSAGFREDLLGGFRYVARQPLIRLLIITGMVMPLFAFPVQLVLPVFAEDVFDRGPEALGILMAVAGVGGLTGALISANMDRVASKGRLMLGAAMLMGVCYIAFALTSDFIPALVVFGVGNIGGMLFMTTNNAAVQAVVDEQVRGRVLSLLFMSFGIMPLGILPITLAIDAFGAPLTVATSSALMIVVLVLIFAFSRQMRDLRLDVLAEAELSPAQAAKLVAEGKISREEADRLTGAAARRAAPPAGKVSGW